MNAMNNVIRCLAVVGCLMGACGHAGEVLLSPRASEFRHSVRRVAEPAREAFDRGVPVISPRHEANRVRMEGGPAEERLPRAVVPLSPRAASQRESVRSR